jgi:peptidyl-prolyl cis-trans isomerase C
MPVSAGVLAQVNGKGVTDEDFQALIAGLPMRQRELAQKDAATKKRILQDLIDQELMVQEASVEKLDASREFKDALQLMRKQALVNLLVSKKLAPKVTEASVKEFYQRNKTRYSTDQVHAQHILLATQAEAESVLAEAKKGADFSVWPSNARRILRPRRPGAMSAIFPVPCSMRPSPARLFRPESAMWSVR